MKYKVGIVSLGCAKNQVDAEMLLASLNENHFEIVEDVAFSDAAIVNTCSFIEPAKQESIEEILEELDPDPREHIEIIIERKYKKALTDEKGKRRAVAALQRMGYSWSDINAVIGEYEEEII